MLQGDVGEANTDVTQIVKLLTVGGAKWNWLLNNIVQFMSSGSVLIFVTKKVRCKTLNYILDNEFAIVFDFLLYVLKLELNCNEVKETVCLMISLYVLCSFVHVILSLIVSLHV
jgi:uncharacterized membrane protein YozB (DUF420 family)